MCDRDGAPREVRPMSRSAFVPMFDPPRLCLFAEAVALAGEMRAHHLTVVPASRQGAMPHAPLRTQPHLRQWLAQLILLTLTLEHAGCGPCDRWMDVMGLAFAEYQDVFGARHPYGRNASGASDEPTGQ